MMASVTTIAKMTRMATAVRMGSMTTTETMTRTAAMAIASMTTMSTCRRYQQKPGREWGRRGPTGASHIGRAADNCGSEGAVSGGMRAEEISDKLVRVLVRDGEEFPWGLRRGSFHGNWRNREKRG